MTLGFAELAAAQPSVAPAPAKGSTGPTVPDTRQVDHGTLSMPTGNAALASPNSTSGGQGAPSGPGTVRNDRP